MEGARVSDFFTKYPNLKKKLGLGEGGRVSDFFDEGSKSKIEKKNIFFGGEGGGVGGLELVNYFYYESKFKI